MTSAVSRFAPTSSVSAMDGEQISPSVPPAGRGANAPPSPGIASSIEGGSGPMAARFSLAADNGWPRNPHLTQPKLFMTRLGSNVTKRGLARDIFNHCLPVKFEFDDLVTPNMGTGIVHFSHLSYAELAYATIDSPVLSIHPPSAETTDPEAQAKRRLIDQLPPQIRVAEVFRLLRPFGPLRKVSLITTSAKTGQTIGFRGGATAEFYLEEDAKVAERALHCSDVGGNSISVTIDTINRAPHYIRAMAPVFVPRAAVLPSAGSQASAFASSPSPSPGFYNPASPLPLMELGGGYPSAPVAPITPSWTKPIDPCNLFIKHLAPTVSSSDLYKAFSPFGDIVSARVMRDDVGNSRLFGFVSYKHAGEAAEALCHMHRSKLDGQPITVSLHQPKMARQEKFARSASVSACPSLPSTVLLQRAEPGTPMKRICLQRKKSNSYFRDAIEADLRGERYTYAQLAALSGSVRDEVLAGLLTRWLKKENIAAEEGVQHTETLEEAKARRQANLTRASRGEGSCNPDPAPVNWTDEDVQQIVEGMVAKMSLSDTVDALDSPAVLLEQALRYANTVKTDLPFQWGTMLGGAPLGGIPSVPPDHSCNSTTGTPALFDVPTSFSAPTATSEGDKLLLAIWSLGLPISDSMARDIRDLLAGLPKKELALCLFNQETLSEKVQEARDILALTGDDDEMFVSSSDSSIESIDTLIISLTSHELLHYLQSGALAPCYLPAPEEEWAATEAYMNSLRLLSVTEAKQHLGARLFTIIKMAGIRGAAKLTITLLDSEDLEALAHLADSFPTILQEKAIKMQI